MIKISRRTIRDTTNASERVAASVAAEAGAFASAPAGAPQSAAARWARHLVEREGRRLALWAPALLALGVAAWFSWPGAHPGWLGPVSGAAAAILALAAARSPAAPTRRPALIGLALVAAGLAAADFRAVRVDAPIWPHARSADVVALEGRVVAIDASARGAPRLLLDQVRISALEPPLRRVRVTLGGLEIDAARRLLGRTVALRTRLRPPPPPVEPGGYDPRRQFYFAGVGAVGFADAPPQDLGPAPTSDVWDAAFRAIDAARARIAASARAAAPGPGGEIVAALLVGDRSGVASADVDALRDSNLAHLLAISGLHMAMVALGVFVVVRRLASLLSRPILDLPPKKLAALAGLAAAAAYLLLAGASVATQRAFVMAAVFFAAILLDRPAVTLRAVAAAALIILLIAPESLFGPGFQLSFAATAALVAAFEAARPTARRLAAARAAAAERSVGAGGVARSVILRVALYAGALAATSLIAGLATAPLAGLHFQRVAYYGLPANLAAMPVMGFWVMPAGVAAMVLEPFGLAEPAYRFMAAGVDVIRAIAALVAEAPGATGARVAAEGVLPWLALGGLIVVIHSAAALKLVGGALIVVGLLTWSTARRPDVLIAPGGGLIGVMTVEGRAFDRERAGRFAASVWLRRDGDPVALEIARRRSAFSRFSGGAAARLPHGWRLELALAERLDGEALRRSCRGPTIVVAPRAAALDAPPPDRCVVLTDDDLDAAVAITVSVDRARARRADPFPRPWNAAE